MALVNYSSSSDTESDVDTPKPKVIKLSSTKRLPLPTAIINMNKKTKMLPTDDPSKHEGRIRSFDHERGNWATIVYIPVELGIIDEVQTTVQDFFKEIVDLKFSDKIHISLTKTVILRHHWIDSFVKSLHGALASFEHFPLDFHAFDVYVNEERTRTFIGLVAGDNYYPKLCEIMNKMDKLMIEYRLETFYENPSFHISFLWCVGDFENVFKERLEELNAILTEMRMVNPDEFRIRIDEIQCNSGNKTFNFKLK